jgi:hypothetical protein
MRPIIKKIIETCNVKLIKYNCVSFYDSIWNKTIYLNLFKDLDTNKFCFIDQHGLVVIDGLDNLDILNDPDNFQDMFSHVISDIVIKNLHGNRIYN